MSRRILIVGGVAGGASCAARLRRLDESAEIVAIDRGARTIAVRDLKSGATRTERYDALVLSPGAAPIRPPLSGVDLPGVFAIRSIPDSRRIRDWISSQDAKTAV